MGRKSLHVMQEGEQYGGVIFLKQIPNPGDSSVRYCEVQCIYCEAIVGRIYLYVNKGNAASCGCMSKASPVSISVGDLYQQKQGYTMKIVQYNNSKDVIVEFIDNGLRVKTSTESIVKGKVKNPYHKTVSGVGYNGEIKSSSPHYAKLRERWRGMIKRVTDGKRAAYDSCEVCDEWLNFANFYEWAIQETNGNIDGLDLDKDILSSENKIYSPETCAFIPCSLNQQLSSIDNTDAGHYDSHSRKWRTNSRCKDTGKLIFKNYETKEEMKTGYVLEKVAKFKKLAEFYKDSIPDRIYVAIISRAEAFLSLETEEGIFTKDDLDYLIKRIEEKGNEIMLW